MSQYKIRLPDDKVYDLIHIYSLPTWMTEYFEGESILYNLKDDETISVPHVEDCQLCGKPFEEATKPNPFFCQSKPVNRELGYVGKICSDCWGWIELQRNNDSIPKSIRKTVKKGHKPKRFLYLLE